MAPRQPRRSSSKSLFSARLTGWPSVDPSRGKQKVPVLFFVTPFCQLVPKTVVFETGAVVLGVGAPGHLNRVSNPVSKSTCQNCGMSLSSGTFATRPVGPRGPLAYTFLPLVPLGQEGQACQIMLTVLRQIILKVTSRGPSKGQRNSGVERAASLAVDQPRAKVRSQVFSPISWFSGQ